MVAGSWPKLASEFHRIIAAGAKKETRLLRDSVF